MDTLLIVGTEESVGKTVFISALAAYWQTYRSPSRLGIFKPVDMGQGDHTLYAQRFSLGQSPEEITPISLKSALVPAIAAAQAGQPIRLERLWKHFEALSQKYDWLLMEGTGSLGTPLTPETTLADLAWDWRLPTVLVVPVRPGAIAQAVANVALAAQCRVHLKGIVLNCVEPRSPQDIEEMVPVKLLQSLTQKPVLGCIPHLKDTTDLEKLAHVASDLTLERVMAV